MSEQKHTPKPWSYEKGFICGPGGYGFGVSIAEMDDDPHGNMEADAHLIIAAPDLLEVVRKCARLYSGRSDPPPAILVEARAAIAKAEGREA